MTIQVKDTNTTMFLVPGLGLKVPDLKLKGFINAYLSDASKEVNYEECVYLLFKAEDLTEFQTFVVSEYQRTKQLIEDYDYEGNYVVLVYQFPEEFKKEFKLFRDGKYSKFRQKYIALIPQITVKIANGKMTQESSIPFMACKQARALKEYWEGKIGETLDEDSEYWPKPDLNKKEVLNINIIRDERGEKSHELSTSKLDGEQVRDTENN